MTDRLPETASAPRVLFDLSTIMRWTGPPVGILRAAGELARFARRTLPDVRFVFFDPDTHGYRLLRDAAVDPVLDEDAVIDPIGLPDPTGTRRHGTDRIPAGLRPAAFWVLQSRHQALMALERLRLAGGAASGVAAAVQDRLAAAKDRAVMMRGGGDRRPVLSRGAALGPTVAFGPDDVLVCAGTGWHDTDIAAVVREKRETGFRLALLCYDLMPLTLPDCFQPHDRALFDAYMRMALPAADLVLVNAACTADDIRAWCGAQGLGVPRTAVVPLGADGPVAPDTGEAAPLPAGLAAGRYALFVSTLEPRKNHRVLVAAWRRLIESGAPGIAGFRLVFVGRAGWGSGPLRDEIAADPRLAATIVHLAGVEDATVATLYRGAAFCCYPSRCEGYGLPVVEAFRFGKAVLASTGGALPEVVADFSPCLDPDDVDAWTAALRSWIADPAARAVHETRIRTAFRHPGWDAAAARFFACVHEATGSVAGSPGI